MMIDSGADDYGETIESCEICAELKLKGANFAESALTWSSPAPHST